jgi:HD-like signal output (HDOD) protein
METKEIEGKIKQDLINLPLVDVAMKDVLDLLEDPESNFDHIINILSPDIAAQFISIANSAFYEGEVTSLKHAISILGYTKMKEILVSSFLMDHFLKASDLTSFDYDKFQRQSHFCATVAWILGEALNYEKKEDLFTIALFNNIGKLVLSVYFPEQYTEIVTLKQREHLSSNEAEKHILGLDHGDIGALILERFGIHHATCQAVGYHEKEIDNLPDAVDFQMIMIVREATHIVDRLALPRKEEVATIKDHLHLVLTKAKEMTGEIIRTEMRDKGYREVFGDLVRQVSDMFYDELSRIYSTR